MIVALFGATGPTGSHVLRLLLERGHQVNAVVRDPAKLTTEHPNLRVIRGDVFSHASVKEAVTGVDAAISCLGIGGMGDGKRTTLVSEGTGRIVKELAPGTPFSCISNTGVGNSAKAFPWKMRHIDIRFKRNWRWFRAVLADKARMERAVRKSQVAYTIVRSPQIMMDWPASQGVVTSPDGLGIPAKVGVQDLADFLIQSVEKQTWRHQAVCIATPAS